jgi:lipoprotein-releasing system ATP-binding protein
MPLLVAKDLHKTYAGQAQPLEVLKGVDLELVEGEAMALLGASGAGKSTLLHCLGTLDEPTHGRVLFEGQDVFRLNDKQLGSFRNRSLGFVFQFHHLLPMLTALENTMLPSMIAGESKATARNKAKELLGRVGLSDRLAHRPSELSGGEQQRVAIARALVMGPKLLLADEPTGNLDSKTGEEVAELMTELCRMKGMALLVATHNEPLAKRLGRRVHLKDGKIAPSVG